MAESKKNGFWKIGLSVLLMYGAVLAALATWQKIQTVKANRAAKKMANAGAETPAE